MTKENLKPTQDVLEMFKVVDNKLNAMNNFYGKNLEKISLYYDDVKKIKDILAEIAEVVIPKSDKALELIQEVKPVVKKKIVKKKK